MSDEPACRFHLSVEPPSTNNIYRGRRWKTDAYRNWKTAAGWEINGQHPPSVIRGRVRVLIEVPFTLNRDIDNIKPLLDLCSTMGLIENDNRVDELIVRRVPRTHRTMVAIWPM